MLMCDNCEVVGQNPELEYLTRFLAQCPKCGKSATNIRDWHNKANKPKQEEPPFANITLRDWFAGQALVGCTSLGGGFDKSAVKAYAYADAMMKERDKCAH